MGFFLCSNKLFKGDFNMNLVTVRDIYKNRENYLNKEIEVGGWVRSIRDSKAFGFLVLADGSYFETLQIVFHDNMDNFDEICKCNVGAAVIVKGTLIPTPEAKQPFEIQAVSVAVEGPSAPDYPLQKKRHSLEYLRTISHLRPRTNTFQAVFRVRSLIAALKVRDRNHYQKKVVSSAYNRVLFTKEMKKDYTLLCPQMSPIHFDLIEPAIRAFGYNMEILQNHNRNAVDVGLQYVNNDACYPSLIVIGQIMDALLSGKYDLNRTAVFMSQTGGGCRASNYIGFIRRALEKAGMPQVPVISVNANGMETNPGFSITLPMMTKAMQAVVYGDIFMRVLYATRPYEAVPGSANALHEKWKKICIKALSKRQPAMMEFAKNVRGIIRDFDNLERLDIKKPKVGIVGEILVKFSPLANNHVVELLESEGAEAVMPDLLDFLLYCFYNSNFKAEHLGMKKSTARLCNAGIALLEFFRKTARKELAASKHFTPPSEIRDLAEMAKGFVSLGNQTGEGWFLTGEMLELIHSGVKNIICTQPFGCLPNHIVGKGVIKELRKNYPESNIIAVDYDPGASEVNQLNRIKLMLATAQKNLKAENA